MFLVLMLVLLALRQRVTSEAIVVCDIGLLLVGVRLAVIAYHAAKGRA